MSSVIGDEYKVIPSSQMLGIIGYFKERVASCVSLKILF
jgi:hypothetical protein